MLKQKIKKKKKKHLSTDIYLAVMPSSKQKPRHNFNSISGSSASKSLIILEMDEQQFFFSFFFSQSNLKMDLGQLSSIDWIELSSSFWNSFETETKNVNQRSGANQCCEFWILISTI